MWNKNKSCKTIITESWNKFISTVEADNIHDRQTIGYILIHHLNCAVRDTIILALSESSGYHVIIPPFQDGGYTDLDLDHRVEVVPAERADVEHVLKTPKNKMLLVSMESVTATLHASFDNSCRECLIPSS